MNQKQRGRPIGSKNRTSNSEEHKRIIAVIKENLTTGKFPLGMNPYNISQELEANDMTTRKYCRDLVALGTLEAVPIGKRSVVYRPVTKQ